MPAEHRSPHAYIPNTDSDRQAMLDAIGVSTPDELFADIPQDKRNPKLNLPAALSEWELLAQIDEIAAKNAHGRPSFLGAGAYNHHVPAIIDNLRSRGEFSTAYTPYQPEISQGTLQYTFELQTMVCELTGMEVANSGMYDGASGSAEAALMATRITGRKKILILDSVHPNTLEVVRTYAQGQDIEVEVVSSDDTEKIDDETACVLVQSPNHFGYIEDQAAWANAAHRNGAKMISYVNNPMSLGLFETPGTLGADIVTGEFASLGNPPNFGGPNNGIFAARMENLRQMPGRIVGQAKELNIIPDQTKELKTGYALVLLAREQFIRRERATSNICTSEALVALGTAIYLSVVGPKGLAEIARLNYDKAHYAAQKMSQVDGYQMALAGVFFNEFVLKCPLAPKEINSKLFERGVIGGVDVSDQIPDGLLLCFTELNTRQQIDELAAHLASIAKGE